jgi:hypothetical protein
MPAVGLGAGGRADRAIGFTPLTDAREPSGGYDGPASYVATLRNTDNDGDGRISVAEYEAGVRAMMLSNDPATLGTALLGQAP